MFKISGLKYSLRSGKWLKNEEEKQRLLREAYAVDDRLMKDILAFAKPGKTKFVDHRPTQGEAFLELAALNGIGFDWIKSSKFVDDALYQEIFDAINYKPGAFQYSHEKAKVSAAILLIELSHQLNTDEYIPLILSAYPPSPKFTPSSLVNQNMRTTEETDLNQWFFWRLAKFINDERVVDFLFQMLELDITFPFERNFIPGPGYHAAELLVIQGEERGIKALVPKILSPKPNIPVEIPFFSHAYNSLNKTGLQLSSSSVPDKGQLPLLIKHLKEALKSDDQEIQSRATFALCCLRDKEEMGMVYKLISQKRGPDVAYAISFLGNLGEPQVIPFLINLLGDNNSLKRINAKTALENLKPVWTPTPFLDALSHEDKRIRRFAVRAIGEIGNDSMIKTLKPLLEDGDRQVRKDAQKAIKRL